MFYLSIIPPPLSPQNLLEQSFKFDVFGEILLLYNGWGIQNHVFFFIIMTSLLADIMSNNSIFKFSTPSMLEFKPLACFVKKNRQEC